MTDAWGEPDDEGDDESPQVADVVPRERFEQERAWREELQRLADYILAPHGETVPPQSFEAIEAARAEIRGLPARLAEIRNEIARARKALSLIAPEPEFDEPLSHYIRRCERSAVEQAMTATAGDTKAAAKALRVARTTLYQIIRRTGLDKQSYG